MRSLKSNFLATSICRTFHYCTSESAASLEPLKKSETLHRLVLFSFARIYWTHHWTGGCWKVGQKSLFVAQEKKSSKIIGGLCGRECVAHLLSAQSRRTHRRPARDILNFRICSFSHTFAWKEVGNSSAHSIQLFSATAPTGSLSLVWGCVLPLVFAFHFCIGSKLFT